MQTISERVWLNQKNMSRSRSHGLVVKAYGSWQRGCGFKPRHRILDGCKRFASYYIKEKLKINVAKWGAPKIKKLKLIKRQQFKRFCLVGAWFTGLSNSFSQLTHRTNLSNSNLGLLFISFGITLDFWQCLGELQ